jgi:hypothetical protein
MLFQTFCGLAFVTRESLTILRGSIFDITFGLSVDSRRCDGCFESKQTGANRARFCAPRNSASLSGQKREDTELVIKIPPLRVAELATGEKQTGRGICGSIRSRPSQQNRRLPD